MGVVAPGEKKSGTGQLIFQILRFHYGHEGRKRGGLKIRNLLKLKKKKCLKENI